MNTFLVICITLSLFSVIGVLAIGLFSMTRGGDFNKKYGNKLMKARVILQGLTIALVALALFSAQK